MKHSSDDRVTVYLAIESTDFTPEMLTRQLEIPADREWLIGQARGKTGKRWALNGWVIETIVSSSNVGGRPAHELIPIALKDFEQRIIPIAKAIGSLGSSVQSYIVLAVVAEEIPGIELDATFLRLLTEIGGTFQVDLKVGQ